MGKKTIVPIKGKGYEFTEATLSSITKGERRRVTLGKKIIALLIECTFSGGQKGHTFYYNPNLKFWTTGDLTLLDTIVAPFNCYVYNTASALTVTKVSDYSVELYNPATTMPTIRYIAILEDDSVGSDPLFLLANTVLYTDGTPTTSVTGAIQTIATNKYKIKANALVTITGATYVNISN